MNEPASKSTDTPERPDRVRAHDSDASAAGSERRSVRLSPKLVLLILIGSCYAFGYTIYLLLKGMHR